MKLLSRVRLLATPWTAAHQAPPSMIRFVRQEYWSGVPLPSPLICNICCSLGASLVAQQVKNLPAMQETWVQSLDWEVPLEKGMATHSIILCSMRFKSLSFKDNFIYFLNLIDSPRYVNIYFCNLLVAFMFFLP